MRASGAAGKRAGAETQPLVALGPVHCERCRRRWPRRARGRIGLVPGIRPDDASGESGSSMRAPAPGRQSSSPVAQAASPSVPAAGSSPPPDRRRPASRTRSRHASAEPSQSCVVMRRNVGLGFAPDGATVLTATRMARPASGAPPRRAARRLPQPHRADKGAVLAERKAIVTTVVATCASGPWMRCRRSSRDGFRPCTGPAHPGDHLTPDGSHLVAWEAAPGPSKPLGPHPAASLPDGPPGSIFSVSPDGRLIAYDRGVKEAVTGSWRWRSSCRARRSAGTPPAWRSPTWPAAWASGRPGQGQVGILGRDPRSTTSASHATAPWPRRASTTRGRHEAGVAA